MLAQALTPGKQSHRSCADNAVETSQYAAVVTQTRDATGSARVARETPPQEWVGSGMTERVVRSTDGGSGGVLGRWAASPETAPACRADSVRSS